MGGLFRTRNDKSKQGWSGGPITGDITTVEYYNTIFSLAESPDQAGLIYAGTDDGLLHITTNGGANWRNITPKGLPEWATIESIHVPKSAPKVAFVVAHNYRLNDDAPYLYITSDNGKSWIKLGAKLPLDLTLWAVRTDPDDANYIYLGTQRGVWYSDNAGQSFQTLKLNLPQVTVTDLETKHGDLIVATRGRSIWALENLAALRAMKQALTFLPTAAATRFATDFRWGDEADGMLDGKDYGVNGQYWLCDKFKATAKTPVKLEIFDATGKRIRLITSIIEPAQYQTDDPDEPTEVPEASLTANAGSNAFNWDLRSDGAKRLMHSKLDFGSAESGPLLPPGRYTAALTVGELSAKTTFEVLGDPRTKTSAADIAQDYEFARTLIAEIDRARQMIEGVRALRRQLKAQINALEVGASDNEKAQALRTSGAALDKKLANIEGKLHNPSAKVVYDVLSGRDGGAKLYHQLVPLYAWAQSADDAPTQGMRERHAQLLQELEKVDAEYAAMRSAELAGYQQALSAMGGMIAL